MCKSAAGIKTLEFCDTQISRISNINTPFDVLFVCLVLFLGKTCCTRTQIIEIDYFHSEETHYGCHDVPNQY